MLDTFLFDLDGTLLPLDIDKFIHIYFQQISTAFCDIANPQKLCECIGHGTKAMIENVESKTNEEVFITVFNEMMDEDFDIFQKRFDMFYDNEFLKTKAATHDVSQSMQKSIALLKDKGYQLVVATNPLFPRKAVLHRIEWAGLNPADFIYISSYENSHYCKPQIHYYDQILQKIGKQPQQCMMVGNDVQEDLVASKLGMQTFLITNHLINRNNEEIVCTDQGSYDDFYAFVKGL